MGRGDVAHGPGPRWVRHAVAGLAGLYYLGLVVHPPQVGVLRSLGFFVDATALFPNANAYAQEFRVEGWSCERSRWEPLDPSHQFPIEASNKESSFQRFNFFYQHNKRALAALDAWITEHHTDDDGLAGAIGGIRLYKWLRPIPPVGESIVRYQYEPLSPIAYGAERKDFYLTEAHVRRERCKR